MTARAEPHAPDKAKPARANVHSHKEKHHGQRGAALSCSTFLLPRERVFGNRNSFLIFPNCPVIRSVVPDLGEMGTTEDV